MLLDGGPGEEDFLGAVLAGLGSSPKTLPCKFFYDERGSALFDRICELPEYYLTRTELGIVGERGAEIRAHLGTGCRVVEYGSGSSLKTRILLELLEDVEVYIPIDISKERLVASAQALDSEYPDLHVAPVCADYSTEIDLPARRGGSQTRAARASPGWPASGVRRAPPATPPACRA